jgi:hypothetical protein
LEYRAFGPFTKVINVSVLIACHPATTPGRGVGVVVWYDGVQQKPL